MDRYYDPYASIMEPCHRTRCKEARLRNRHTPLVLPPPEAILFADDSPLYGAIPPHSISKFLCVTPDPPNVNYNDEYHTPSLNSSGDNIYQHRFPATIPFSDESPSYGAIPAHSIVECCTPGPSKVNKDVGFHTPVANSSDDNIYQPRFPATILSADESPSFGAIRADSNVEFVCCTPGALNVNNDVEFHSPVANSSDNNLSELNNTPPLCVVSFEDSLPSPPPTPKDILLGSSDIEGITCEGQRMDGSGRLDADPFGGLGLWLSKLKFMAMSHEFSDVDRSFLTDFRIFSSSKLKGQNVSVSVSGKSPSKKRKNSISESRVGLGSSSRYNTRSKTVEANAVNEVDPLEYLSVNKSLGLSSKSKRKNVSTVLSSKEPQECQLGSEVHESRIIAEATLSGNNSAENFGTMAVDGGCTKSNPFNCLEKLKSTAKLECFYTDVVPYFTKFRAQYWVSEGHYPSKKKSRDRLSNSKVMKSLVSILGEPPLKKMKLSDNNVGLKLSTSRSGCDLVEMDDTAVNVLSGEEEGEGEGEGTLRISGHGNKIVNNKGTPLKICDVECSKTNKSHTDADGNLLRNEKTGYFGNSNDVCPINGNSRCPGEQAEWDYSTSDAVEENAATTAAMVPGTSSSKNAFLTMVFHSLQRVRDGNPGSSSGNVDDSDGNCQTRWYDFLSSKMASRGRGLIT